MLRYGPQAGSTHPTGMHSCFHDIITTHKHSLRRLCFYTCLSVILFTGGACSGGGSAPRGWGCLLPGGGGVCAPPTHPPDGICCGRYASYWNAFLFNCVFHNCNSLRNWHFVQKTVPTFFAFFGSTFPVVHPLPTWEQMIWIILNNLLHDG